MKGIDYQGARTRNVRCKRGCKGHPMSPPNNVVRPAHCPGRRRERGRSMTYSSVIGPRATSRNGTLRRVVANSVNQRYVIYDTRRRCTR